jgi:hypothetical protein
MQSAFGEAREGGAGVGKHAHPHRVTRRFYREHEAVRRLFGPLAADYVQTPYLLFVAAAVTNPASSCACSV